MKHTLYIEGKKMKGQLTLQKTNKKNGAYN